MSASLLAATGERAAYHRGKSIKVNRVGEYTDTHINNSSAVVCSLVSYTFTVCIPLI